MSSKQPGSSKIPHAGKSPALGCGQRSKIHLWSTESQRSAAVDSFLLPPRAKHEVYGKQRKDYCVLWTDVSTLRAELAASKVNLHIDVSVDGCIRNIFRKAHFLFDINT